jgi:predicted transcriptional regulator
MIQQGTFYANRGDSYPYIDDELYEVAEEIYQELASNPEQNPTAAKVVIKRALAKKLIVLTEDRVYSWKEAMMGEAPTQRSLATESVKSIAKMLESRPETYMTLQQKDEHIFGGYLMRARLIVFRP